MGTEPFKKQTKQKLALHKTSYELGEYCNPNKCQQLQHEWKVIFPHISGEREIIHKAEIHDHQRHLVSWVND